MNRGIVTDADLPTSDQDIYALDDCAETEGQLRPYVLPIMHAARALARTLAGTPTPVAFPPMPIVIKTPACPVVVQPVTRDATGDWEIAADERGVKGLFRDPVGRLTGFALAKLLDATLSRRDMARSSGAGKLERQEPKVSPRTTADQLSIT